MIPWEDNFDKLSRKQKELIIGSVLGDGRLECRSLAKTARLRIHHADSQKDYLFWKFNELKSLSNISPNRHEYIDKRSGTKVVSWYFHTRTSASLGKLYGLFYKDGVKILPKNLLKILTPFALAIWVMDDGCFYKQSLILNTQNFTIKENKDLQNVFKEMYGVEGRMQKDRNNFRLYFSRQSTEKIKIIVQPFIFNQNYPRRD
jgi:hypothetical protein